MFKLKNTLPSKLAAKLSKGFASTMVLFVTVLLTSCSSAEIHGFYEGITNPENSYNASFATAFCDTFKDGYSTNTCVFDGNKTIEISYGYYKNATKKNFANKICKTIMKDYGKEIESCSSFKNSSVWYFDLVIARHQ
jgi:hypothetical protein